MNICCQYTVYIIYIHSFVRNSFRPAYGKLDVLVSIFPEIPHLATTATATLKSQKEICDRLQIIDPVVISVNPDRSNIFLE
jgi:superfamily II DNA helicase RecQ